MPISNPLMIKLSSTVYNSLIEHIHPVASKNKDDACTAISLDGDDVYY